MLASFDISSLQRRRAELTAGREMMVQGRYLQGKLFKFVSYNFKM